jgi:hypothetical protein
MHGVCQLTLVLFQLMLRLCYLMLYRCQLSRQTEYELRPSLCQLLLGISQFLLRLCQRMRTLDDDGLAQRARRFGGRKRKFESLRR